MPIGDVLNTGVEGYNRAAQGIEQATAEINRATLPEQSPEQQAQQRQLQGASSDESVVAPVSQPAKIDEAYVNLKVEEFNAKANTQTIRTADEVLGTIIDIRA
jgi:hypothetical protein